MLAKKCQAPNHTIKSFIFKSHKLGLSTQLPGKCISTYSAYLVSLQYRKLFSREMLLVYWTESAGTQSIIHKLCTIWLNCASGLNTFKINLELLTFSYVMCHLEGI